jgi:DNA mismatch endonuclease (patch repair protein)
MDCLTPVQRHKAMVGNRNRDTKIEIIFRKALWNKGIRYRKNYKLLNYHPDVVITKYKIAIFCDGDFWHGKNYHKKKIYTNEEYWDNKIKRNIERDLECVIALRDLGWHVFRFWESDIKKNVDECVQKIIDEINLLKYLKEQRLFILKRKNK